MSLARPEAPGDRLLGWKQVRELAGISRTTAWRLQKAGAFPRPVVISKGRVGWRESEILAWKSALTPRMDTSVAIKPARPLVLVAEASARAAGPRAPPPAKVRRRGPAISPNQISFEF